MTDRVKALEAIKEIISQCHNLPHTATAARIEELARALLALSGGEKEKARKDAAYLERNQVVAALASAFPSGIARTAIPGWSEDWHGCVYIDLPTGQASWHFHDSHAHLFAHLPPYGGKWDGHTTDEKYARVAALAASPFPAVRDALEKMRQEVDEAIALLARDNGTDRLPKTVQRLIGRLVKAAALSPQGGEVP
jgi:hypothetical protein